MAVVKNHDLRITGRIKVGNIRNGLATVVPVANTPTSVTVTGLSLTGSGTIVGLVTGTTSVPGSEVSETTVSGATSSGMNLWIYRSNTTPTGMAWFMFRKRV
jgi:hypothetical protein